MQTLCHLIYSRLSKGEGFLFISGKQKFNNMETTVLVGGGLLCADGELCY